MKKLFLRYACVCVCVCVLFSCASQNLFSQIGCSVENSDPPINHTSTPCSEVNIPNADYVNVLPLIHTPVHFQAKSNGTNFNQSPFGSPNLDETNIDIIRKESFLRA